MSTRRSPSPTSRRATAWLWTGPVGHFVGGALDLGEALARHLLARVRGRIAFATSRPRRAVRRSR